jgi:membrane protease YdiL (CAAX protease family)
MNDFESTPREPEKNISVAPDNMGAPGPSHLGTWESDATTNAPTELFHSWSQPEAIPPARIPHLGHLALLSAFLLFGLVCMMALMFTAMHFLLEGVSTQEQIKTNVHYLLGSTAVLYLVALALSIPIFPRLWNNSFFSGIHWRGATAFQLGWRLPAIALGCFMLAMLDQVLLPGPDHAPIIEFFRSPGAAWLMFAFGVTFAPFFEEMFFRGFLLPALATAWDWAIEKSTGMPARPLDANGHPQWSIFAMVIASVLTTIPFALMHADQQGYSLGPFLLLIVVSLILCAVRLVTRSLAACTLVHACYNFLIFFTMMVATGGFKHFDKM